MSEKQRRTKKQLTDEDRVLWSKVAKTLTPLEPQKAKVVRPDDITFAELMDDGRREDASQASGKTASKPTPPTATAMRAPKPPPGPPPLHPLEHKVRKKVARGLKPIDARIDLHGLRQDEAHTRLRGFLHDAQGRGHKLVLVITGKGGTGSRTGSWSGIHGEERGVLRRVVPQWLALPDMRTLVIGYEEANISHGGSGALYVRIRRRR
ncbi:Smr/MutS family protein [Roseibium sp. CAU 1637]|uniref:Smr/MutS family protein n=1 Tax=Roseibium limicola TaxID=2816037 RepID=A0A939J6U0_9HYPH|nr:Smr/MutS family protein [Roseibium limicola]